MRNALSVDVEDWFQVGAFEKVIDKADWPRLQSRVARNTDAVLDLFGRAGVKATFFTLGWVAERAPEQMRRIVAEGHEIASHGWDHDRVFTLTPDQFRADLRRARRAIEDAAGQAVTGYRAPSFSIDTRTPWAHPILAEEGYAYSSSVAPVKHDHYGWPESPRFLWKPVADSAMLELPVTTAKLGSRTLAAGGGGFFRLLPYRFSRWAIRQVNAGHGGEAERPAVFYFHPWEIDPAQPRVANASFKSKLRHYSRLSGMEGKLERLLKEFAWDRVDHVVARQVAA
jgi:polysaccharide deacetylase family protein (PEP-CTERM system associated)